MTTPNENVPPTLPLPAVSGEEPPATSAFGSAGPPPPSSGPGQPKKDQTEVLGPPSSDDYPTQARSAPPVSSGSSIPQTITQTEQEVPDLSATAFVAGYEVLGELGRGGMGVVYKARQIGLNRIVALKMVLSGAHASKQELGRFKAEAEAVARLQHPNIVQIYEVGTQDGRPFFSLEYVSGGSLAEKIHNEPLAPRTAAELTEVLARAVHYAHQQGIVHRDLKPGNVLLGQAGDSSTLGRTSSGERTRTSGVRASGAEAIGVAGFIPKITDFGLAKNIKEDSGQTKSGSILGTPNYMAPEQAAGKVEGIGPLADVYALGAIFYELLTGRPPFVGDSPWDVVKQVLNEDPLPPTDLRRSIHRDLETICLRCLRKEPEKRYGSSLDLAEDLRRWLEDKPILARPVSDWERMLKWARRSPGVAALSASLILAIGGGLVGMTTLWLQAESGKRAAERAELSAKNAEQLARERAEEARVAREKSEASSRQSRREAYAARLKLAQNALHEAHVERAISLLGELERRSPGEDDLRGFEWFYLKKVSESGVALRGHTNLVSSVLFSPDGKVMVTASLDGTLRVWDPVSGDPRRELKGHTGPVRCVACSPDGRWLATGSEDRTIRVWDLQGNTTSLHTLKGHEGWVTSVAFSSNGRLLASAGEDRTARLWDLSGEAISSKAGPLLVLKGHAAGLTGLAFSPDSKWLATASWDRTARVWSTSTGQLRFEPLEHSRWVRCISYSRDGKKLAIACWDRSIQLCDAETGKPLRQLRNLSAPTQAMDFSPDSQRMVVLGIDQKAWLWDFALGDQEPQRIGASGPVRGIGFSPDGELMASVRFDFRGKALDARLDLVDARSSVHCLAFRPGPGKAPSHLAPSHLAAGGADNEVLVWTVGEEGKAGSWKVQTLSGHTGPLRCLAYSADGKLLASGSEDGTVRVWDAGTGETLQVLGSHGGWVTGLAFSPDGKKLATACEDHLVRLWNLNGGGEATRTVPAQVLERHPEGVLAVAWDTRGETLASADGSGEVRLWDPATGKLLRKLVGHAGQVRALSFSLDGGRLASAGWDGKVILWNVAEGKAEQTLVGHTYGVTGVCFSADGKRLASSSEDRTVKLWELTGGRELLSLTAHEAGVTGVALSADGSYLASACWDQIVRVWHAPRGK